MFPAETTTNVDANDVDEKNEEIVTKLQEETEKEIEEMYNDKEQENYEQNKNYKKLTRIEINNDDENDEVDNNEDKVHKMAQKSNDKDKNMLENIEHFGSLIGEELVNTYWRRGFNMPATPAATTTTTTSTTLNANKNFPVPAQLQQQQAVHHSHHHSHHLQQQQHNMSLHTHPHFPARFPPSHSTNHAHPMFSHHQQQQHQQQHGPSSTTLLSQLVNSTFSTTTPHHSLRTDALHHSQQFQQQTNANMDGDKISNHHNESSTSASTPNLSEASRLADHEHLHGTHSLNGSMSSLSMSLSKFHEDNNNSLCATPNSQTGLPGHPHLPSGFLPGLPFQFQERGHFRFADDLQLPPGASMAGRLGESLIPKGDPMEAKLQEMLRYNMDKYANQALDTLHISRRVRELLSVHNIGQRLFAKYILGLSQGTVSELLSKPKPWDKLTEKGRDSYRKMHAWGCDDNAVMLLKSLIPKKGK